MVAARQLPPASLCISLSLSPFLSKVFTDSDDKIKSSPHCRVYLDQEKEEKEQVQRCRDSFWKLCSLQMFAGPIHPSEVDFYEPARGEACCCLPRWALWAQPCWSNMKVLFVSKRKFSCANSFVLRPQHVCFCQPTNSSFFKVTRKENLCKITLHGTDFLLDYVIVCFTSQFLPGNKNEKLPWILYEFFSWDFSKENSPHLSGEPTCDLQAVAADLALDEDSAPPLGVVGSTQAGNVHHTLLVDVHVAGCRRHNNNNTIQVSQLDR